MRGTIAVSALALVLAACGGNSGGGGNTNPQQFTLRITTSGGGSVRGAGTDCRSSCSAQYAKGTQVHLVAVPDAGATFTGWAGACSGTGGCDLTLDADRDVSAAFTGMPPPPVGKHHLTVVVQGHGRVTSTPAGVDCDSSTCTADFDDGTSVALSATAASGFNFDGWGAGCSGTGGCTITLTSDRTIFANFTAQGPPPPPPQVHLTASVTGPGTVTGGGLNCGESTFTCDVTVAGGSSVTLTAAPAGGTRFTGWGGACSGTATTCQLTLNADTKVTAEFQSEVMSLAPNDGTNGFAITINSTHLFWQRYNGGNAIWAVPKKGGDAARIVGATVAAMVVDDSYLYWTDYYNLYSTPVGGGEVAQLASAFPIGRLALDETGALYWVVSAFGNNAGSVHRMQGRVDKVIASGQHPAGAVAVDDTFVYFTDYDGHGSVRRVPRNGGTVDVLVSCSNNCFFNAVRVDFQNVYYRDNTGNVFSRSKSNGAVRQLSGPNGSSGYTFNPEVEVNASVVYWNWNGGSAPYGIFRANPDGTGFAAVDTSNEQSWNSLRVDDDALYYYHAGSIIRRLK